jgi:hypothetical protein
MILGCMQPYFFPYLGYFDLINRCDKWVVFDTAKYMRRHWVNRNRILHPTSGWQYISVPVNRGTDGGAIADVRISDKAKARRRILAQLAHYRQKRAPFFAATIALVEGSFDNSPGDQLAELAVAGLSRVCDYLGIDFEPVRLSCAGLALPMIESAGQWAVEISAAVGASDYINAPGGRALFRPDEFARRGVRLHFADLITLPYAMADRPFIDHLSIIDVLMWNAPDAVKGHLDRVRGRWLEGLRA